MIVLLAVSIALAGIAVGFVLGTAFGVSQEQRAAAERDRLRSGVLRLELARRLEGHR